MKGFASFFVKNKGDGEKKKLSPFENLVIIVVVGVIIILAGGLFAKPSNSDAAANAAGTESQGQNPGGSSASGAGYDGEQAVMDLEKRLSELLSQVEGAGKVEVMIFADSSSEMVPAYNNQSDSSSNEGTGSKSVQSSERQDLATSGGDSPVILKVIIPEIKGVVVVAEGADDVLVRQQLNDAVCTLLGVPEHRVQILKHK